eukprot:1178558-Prorocentrum_minimum.AAC.1
MGLLFMLLLPFTSSYVASSRRRACWCASGGTCRCSSATWAPSSGARALRGCSAAALSASTSAAPPPTGNYGRQTGGTSGCSRCACPSSACSPTAAAPPPPRGGGWGGEPAPAAAAAPLPPLAPARQK